MAEKAVGLDIPCFPQLPSFFLLISFPKLLTNIGKLLKGERRGVLT